LLYDKKFKKGYTLICDYCDNVFCGCMDY